MVKCLIREYTRIYKKKRFLLLRALILYYKSADFRVLILIRYCVDGKSKFIRENCKKKLLIKYSVAISCNAKIGNGFHLGHYLGLVIGPGVIIGDNCCTYQQVTLGQNHGKFPIIGNNVVIYAGAKVIGDIHIGDNVIIGSNAVVIKDVPDNCIVAGIPARIIKYREDD